MSDLDPGDGVTQHPAAEELAAYLSERLTPADRAALEAHLAECRDCRRQVTSARRLLRQHRAPNRALWLAPAAAAALLLVVLVTRTPGPAGIREEPLRSGETATAIAVVAPAEGDTLDAAGLGFVWNSIPGQPLYHLRLSDASGRPVWTAETSDTTLRMPQAVTLAPGRTYFWLVDALGADGRSLTTRTHRFSTRP